MTDRDRESRLGPHRDCDIDGVQSPVGGTPRTGMMERDQESLAGPRRGLISAGWEGLDLFYHQMGLCLQAANLFPSLLMRFIQSSELFQELVKSGLETGCLGFRNFQDNALAHIRSPRRQA